MSERKLFGTDGIRGKANIYPMTCEVAFNLGRAVTHHFQEENEEKVPVIIIGKDTRLSCYMLEQAFAAGVCSQGGNAILTGPLPTPGVAFVTQNMRAQAGVMISASHNPYFDNGIKLFDSLGNKLQDHVEAHLESLVLNSGLIPVKQGMQLGKAKRLDEVVGRYIVRVKSAFANDMTLDGLRIVVDGANGAAYKVGPMCFEELGAEVIRLGNHPNGSNINDKVGALYPTLCSEAVKKYRADIGVCLDGDADRIVIINEDGDIINGDQLLGILFKYLLDTDQLNGKLEMVGTVMTNLGVENFVKGLGGSLYRAKVGDRYILSRMQESGAVFGGEPSGHIIFKNYSTTGDGILAALKVIECARYYNLPLSKLVEQVPLYPQILNNIKVSEKKKLSEIPGLQKLQADCEGKLGERGRTLIRYSGTENLCRVMVEGDDGAMVQETSDLLTKHIKQEIGE